MNNENPMTTNQSFIKKIFTKRGGSDSSSKTKSIINADVVGLNNGVGIVAEACACCWDRPIPTTYNDKAEYIAKRTRIGHTSVTEHSNCVMCIYISNSYSKDLISFLSACRYLHTSVKESSDHNGYFAIIGGSYRAYSDVFMTIDNVDNAILKIVTGRLYTVSNSAFFEDIINKINDENIIDKNAFKNDDTTYSCANYFTSSIINPSTGVNRVTQPLFDILWVDDADKMLENINNFLVRNNESNHLFKLKDIQDFLSITVLFKNMSRTCTHQLVRHRNGITQESQRYVNYSNADFADPCEFKDKYNPNEKYLISFNGQEMYMTLKEIGEAEINIYRDLTNKEKNPEALLKEDARAFLPSNVRCKKIFMTFTFNSLLKFLELRQDSAAQAEIRTYANAIRAWIDDHYNSIFGHEDDDKNTDVTQEPVGSEEEVVMTQEEIMKSALGPESEKYIDNKEEK